MLSMIKEGKHYEAHPAFWARLWRPRFSRRREVDQTVSSAYLLTATMCEWDEQLQASGRTRPPAGRFWYDRAVKLGSADAARRLPQLTTASAQ
jgi:hypothetical protein